MLARRVLSVLPPVIILKGLRDRPFEWLELSCHFILDEALNLRPGSRDDLSLARRHLYAVAADLGVQRRSRPWMVIGCDRSTCQ